MKIVRDDVILQTIVSLILPFAMVLGIFVILNGHISPGGGFSGGVIFGASFILYDVAFGYQRVQRVLNFRSISLMMVIALGTYGLLKAYSFMLAAAGEPSHIPLGQPGAILSGGLILPLNISVGIIVSLSMYLFFSLFARGEI